MRIYVYIFLLAVISVSCTGPDKKKSVSFNHDIRPIISTNCLTCHGPDPSSREADLRLDVREDALKTLESGTQAIVPFEADRSEIIRRIYSDDPNEVMPPPESKRILSNDQKETIKNWIETGAQYEKFWAFEDIKKTEGSIDEFITESLKQNGLNPDFKLAKDEIILRRLSYILTGLPPSIEDIKRFKKLDIDEKYEDAVDYYLSSPAFGERWARHWMDLVRFAETKGHEFDFPITGAWQYRDYLIRAFNDDIPYDQLVKEHLAGDMIKNPRINKSTGVNESQIATAYMVMGEGTHSPVDIKKDEADRIDNIIDVTSKTFQGMTMACARCHDHKFDDIPTKDYYSLYGVIESSRFTPKPVSDTRKYENLIPRMDSLIEAQRKIITGKGNTGEVLYASMNTMNNGKMAEFSGDDFEDWFVDGKAFGKSPVLVRTEIDTAKNKISGLSGGYASGRYYGTGIYGALRSPTFTISENNLKVIARGYKSSIRIVVDNFQLIQNPIYGGLMKVVNNSEFKDYTFNVENWKGHKAYIEFLNGFYDRHDYKMPKNAFIEVKSVYHTSDKIELKPVTIRSTDKRLYYSLTKTEKDDLLTINSELASISEKLRDSVFFIGITEGDGINSHVFIRGSHTNLSDQKTERGFLSVLPEANISSGSGRSKIADVILDNDNPLTSRVAVNRIWHHMFGKGIVETVDNFGLQGKMPSHPYLLDHLATKFIENEWSLKSMIKYIAVSKTFRQSSERTSKEEKLDPENKLLGSFPIRRLEAEAIRDGVLAATGSLNEEMYGESIPIYLTRFMTGRGRPGKSGPLDGNGRRSIYIKVRRNFLSPFMMTFDRPQPVTTFGKRNITNVPAQSLTLMNDEFIIDQAEKWAGRLLEKNHSNVEERVNEIYLSAFGRLPYSKEINKAEDFLNKQAELLGEDEIMKSKNLWKDYCHSIFNFKEFIHIM